MSLSQFGKLSLAQECTFKYFSRFKKAYAPSTQFFQGHSVFLTKTLDVISNIRTFLRSNPLQKPALISSKMCSSYIVEF